MHMNSISLSPLYTKLDKEIHAAWLEAFCFKHDMKLVMTDGTKCLQTEYYQYCKYNVKVAGALFLVHTKGLFVKYLYRKKFSIKQNERFNSETC